MQKFGIDVSLWQKGLDLKKAKETEGIEFVIIKAGGHENSRYKDPEFENFYNAAKEAGLGVGAYYYSQDYTVEDAEKSAAHFVSLLKGKQFEYPVYMDVEEGMLKLSKAELSKVVEAFCSKVEASGFYAGIYASSSTFNTKLNVSLKKYTLWPACWSKTCPVLKNGGASAIWQYGGDTNPVRNKQICGITTDQDYCYVDFPEIIKKAGLNGFKTEKTESAVPEDVKKPEKPKTHEILKKYIVTAKHGLNIRQEPTTESKSLGVMNKDTVFEVSAIVSDGADWGFIPCMNGWSCLYYAKEL